VRAPLACVVLSLRNQPGLPAAVRSLVEQEPRPEVVVVNSGGGDPAGTLASAGLGDVPVLHREERLFAGAARNLGIAATDAPYVAFLAADSIAEPGWVAGRLRRHLDGAATVACVLTSPPDASRPARAGHLLLNARRMPDTPEHHRLLYGLSYDRELFERFGLFREDMRTGEDSELKARLGDGAAAVWAPDVRTQHTEPARLGDLIRDQYARGRRRVLATRGAGGSLGARKIVRHAASNPRFALEQARRTSDGEERARLIESWPLVVPGALAYMAGGLRAALVPDS
jgi:glycosyltransferase involved in cell wall biosynthesis